MSRILRNIVLVFLVACAGALQAQQLKVIEFRADLTLTDAVQYPKEDFNGERCGLIKLGLALPKSDVAFEGDIISFEYKEGEWWIYMPRDSNWLTIKSKSSAYLPLRYEFEGLQGNVTYVMNVEKPSVGPEPEVISEQYLVFQLLPANAVLEVNGQLWEVESDGTAMKFVDFGTYSYRVQSDGYQTNMGEVIVNDPDKPKIVSLILSRILKDEETFTVDGVSFTMKLVEGGVFQMGTSKHSYDDYDSYDGAVPISIHSVTLSNYYMGESEVTQALWKVVMGTNPSYFKGDNLPVEQVSWNDCQEFIRKLNQKTNRNFRLPTEAEWEYAARGGWKSLGYKYAGSNNISDVAWYWDSSDDAPPTHSVKTKQPNELDLYDMSGNVWEWCRDWYDSSYYSDSPQFNPQGPSSGFFRVLRGGCCVSCAMDCQVSGRDFASPSDREQRMGFRLCLPQ